MIHIHIGRNFQIFKVLFVFFLISLSSATAQALLDADGDGIDDSIDNCKTISNPDQADIDIDKVGNVCDNCVNYSNPRVEITKRKGWMTLTGGQRDDDGDGVGNRCDGDYDNKAAIVGAPDTNNLVASLNPAHLVTDNNCGVSKNMPCAIFDHDGNANLIGAPDTNIFVSLLGTRPSTLKCALCGNFEIIPCSGPNCDNDKDGVKDRVDNCVGMSNPEQLDSNGDLVGDGCNKLQIRIESPLVWLGDDYYLVFVDIKAFNPNNTQITHIDFSNSLTTAYTGDFAFSGFIYSIFGNLKISEPAVNSWHSTKDPVPPHNYPSAFQIPFLDVASPLRPLTYGFEIEVQYTENGEQRRQVVGPSEFTISE